MLRLIYSRGRGRGKLFKHFKTSYVTVNLIKGEPFIYTSKNFKTSYVTVNLYTGTKATT